MPFSMFKRLGLGNPKPVNMVIEMADKSMQSPKGIVENVRVKIHKFIFPVDFVILNVIEDDKVLIILGRPMLATAHARIDIFRGKISLEVGTEQTIFNGNEGATPLTVSPDSGFELTGFSYADYAGCKDTFKSTSGGAQFLGEKMVSWSSKKQECTALSTAEA
nr:hypothetical protein [Tanacetum cinerariifolium]